MEIKQNNFEAEAEIPLTEKEVPDKSRMYRVTEVFFGQKRLKVFTDIGPVKGNGDRFFIGTATLISKTHAPQFQMEFVIRAQNEEEAFQKYFAYFEVHRKQLVKRDGLQIVTPTAADVKRIIRGKME
ncbi:MAG: hypothetical protein H8D45_32690 [Bacteroidetes bacterium]|nr:hypothetical protein [Bacteroidota bacterium]